MRLFNIFIVYRKELRDLLRDRRTIVSMIVVPVLIMPVMMTGMGGAAIKIVSKARQEIPTVMVLGGEDSPKTLVAIHALETIKIVPASADYTNQITEKSIRAAIEIPKGFDAALQNGERTSVQIYVYSGEIRSSFGADALQNFFKDLRDRTVRERMEARNVPEKLLHPLDIRQTNVAPPKKVSGNIIGSIIPYIIIIMCMTGAMYPAIDLTAGEKERGTMETLLCSPVARTHLVVGKCLMVLTASLVTTLLSLTSMGFSFWAAKKTTFAQLPLAIDLSSLAAVFVMMLPLAIFFSATMLTVALFSRTSKEAHSYLQPMLILAIVPALAGILPGVELDQKLALIPVLNVSLVSKEILAGTFHWNYIALIFISTSIYATVALTAAVALFKRESVLFRT
jgi:sodium transport system permease protein